MSIWPKSKVISKLEDMKFELRQLYIHQEYNSIDSYLFQIDGLLNKTIQSVKKIELRRKR